MSLVSTIETSGDPALKFSPISATSLVTSPDIGARMINASTSARRAATAVSADLTRAAWRGALLGRRAGDGQPRGRVGRLALSARRLQIVGGFVDRLSGGVAPPLELRLSRSQVSR